MRVGQPRDGLQFDDDSVGDHDIWRKATVGVALVATDASFAHQVLDKVIDHIESNPRVDLGHCEVELL